MKRLLCFAAASLAVVAAVAGSWSMLRPAAVYADVNDFTITNFSADYYLSDGDPQGRMRIVEKIQVDFRDNNHGIERALPLHYGGHPLHVHVNKVSSGSGAPAKFSASDQNGNKVLRIGDAERTVTGEQEYTVDYQLDNVLNFYDGVPQLYWNVNGVGWSQRFDHVEARLHLAKGLTVNASQKPVCYSGTSGQKGADCSSSLENSGDVAYKVETTQQLPAYGNLSFALNVAGGNFHAEDWRDKVADYWKPVVAATALPIATLAYAWRQWYKRGRDAKGSGVIVAQYEAPDGLTPLQVGTLVDFKTDNRDITATIISLAVRKYIRIVETKQDKLIGSKLSYELVLLNADLTQLTADEKLLVGSLFSTVEVGARRSVNKANSSLATTAKTLSDRTQASLTALGYYKANPLSAGTPLYTFGVILVVVTFVLLHFLHSAALVGALFAGGIAILFARLMPARTPKGVAALEHIQGLKMYMDVAEADRMKALQAPDARYASNSQEPAKTVELFEKLLPYAIVLGVEQGWAKQFESLYATPPDWYAGNNLTAFNVGYLAGHLGTNFQNAVGTSFTPPSSSGSGGFGGGGFSGGGGGGGGGGGW